MHSAAQFPLSQITITRDNQQIRWHILIILRLFAAAVHCIHDDYMMMIVIPSAISIRLPGIDRFHLLHFRTIWCDTQQNHLFLHLHRRINQSAILIETVQLTVNAAANHPFVIARHLRHLIGYFRLPLHLIVAVILLELTHYLAVILVIASLHRRAFIPHITTLHANMFISIHFEQQRAFAVVESIRFLAFPLWFLHTVFVCVVCVFPFPRRRCSVIETRHRCHVVHFHIDIQFRHIALFFVLSLFRSFALFLFMFLLFVASFALLCAFAHRGFTHFVFISAINNMHTIAIRIAIGFASQRSLRRGIQ
mmetsp:Transcript_64051/g.101951  ORF Transcript_64051/g.101951 Transcript_64051/m.101951 type:complete len:308 (-) Transcript_64051:246-1169(-)